MGICSLWRLLWALFGEPCLCGFAAFDSCSGPCLGSRVYGDLQLLTLFFEPFKLCLESCVFGNFLQLLASHVYGDLQFVAAAMGLV